MEYNECEEALNQDLFRSDQMDLEKLNKELEKQNNKPKNVHNVTSGNSQNHVVNVFKDKPVSSKIVPEVKPLKTKNYNLKHNQVLDTRTEKSQMVKI